MIIQVDFTINSQYISCSSRVGRKIRQLQMEFDRWIYDRGNTHPYWVVLEDGDGNEIHTVSFTSEAFIYWLNHVRFKRGKQIAKIVNESHMQPKKKIRF